MRFVLVLILSKQFWLRHSDQNLPGRNNPKSSNKNPTIMCKNHQLRVLLTRDYKYIGRYLKGTLSGPISPGSSNDDTIISINFRK